MLRPDDTIQFFTSPYRRTRETTEGILSTLTTDSEEDGPSPFPRNTIKVFEEPRIREQDFGNFQPCSSEMERMWQERADYGHFFYRIPNGESAADAYDRISGFNESLWRNFSDDDFPSVCVLVTHGLMTRVFLMKWYHWSVEYFEDLRNVNHCEFVVMKKNLESGKYLMQNQLRTWSELKKRAIPQHTAESASVPSPAIPSRKWGGCVGGCNHQHSKFPRRVKNKQTDVILPPPAKDVIPQEEKEDHPVASQGLDASITLQEPDTPSTTEPDSPSIMRLSLRPSFIQGRDGGGSLSGMATPADGLSDYSGAESDYFHRQQHNRDLSDANPNNPSGAAKRHPKRKPTVQDLENWAAQSGMGRNALAERLGDEDHDDDNDDNDDGDDEHDDHDERQTVDMNEPSEIIERLKLQEIQDKSVQGSVY